MESCLMDCLNSFERESERNLADSLDYWHLAPC